MTFGDALELLKEGYPVYRNLWGGNIYIVKQINTDISSNVVPKMLSLPPIAKELVAKSGDGTIAYRQQCLKITIRNQESDGVLATNYVPDWIDMFAEDWQAYGINN